MPRTVLVLAATGTTGREATRALLQRGAAVRAATRDPATATLPEGAEPVRFDLDDETTWDAALAGVDALYLANPPFRTDEVTVARALIQRAVAQGVGRIVKLSAQGVGASPDSSHRQVELAIEAAAVSWIHLRPSFFMENFTNFWGHGIRSDGVIALPAAAGRTGFIAAADIGEAAAEALLGEASGEAWELTGPESLSHDEAAKILSAAAGREIRYTDITPDAFRDGLAAAGMPELGVQTMDWLYDIVRKGWSAGLTDTVAGVLGRPPTRLADWAADHAAALR